MPRLNIFAFPSRTTLLFTLILLVVWLPACAALFGDLPMCGPFICLALWLFPIYAFLQIPDQIRRRHRHSLPSNLQPFKLHVTRLAQECGLKRTPEILLADDGHETIHMVGTFTRHFLIVSEARATKLQQRLESSDLRKQKIAEAILLHELGHIANRDVGQTFLSRAVLAVTMGFISLSCISNAMLPAFYELLLRETEFFTTLPTFALLTVNDPELQAFMEAPPTIESITWVRYEIFNFTTHWPLFMGALFLVIFYWRALLRTRELYADARVVQWQGTNQYLREALAQEQTRIRLRSKPGGHKAGKSVQGWRALSRVAWTRICQWIVKAVRPDRTHPLQFMAPVTPAGNRPSRSLWRMFRDLLRFHPVAKVRTGSLDRPEEVYAGEFITAATAAVTVTLLHLTLGTLLISRFIRSPNASFPFVLGFVILSLSLLPRLLARREPYDIKEKSLQQKTLSHTINRMVVYFTLLKLVPQLVVGFVVAYGVLTDPTMIDGAGYAMVLLGGSDLPSLGISPEFIIEVYVIRPAILFAFVMPPTLIFFLHLDIWIKERLLVCYSWGTLAQHHIALFGGITTTLALLIWAVVLPFYNAATIPTAHTVVDSFILGRMALSVVAIGIAGTYFVKAYRRYAYCCHQCKAVVLGGYWLGKTCPTCTAPLHPWLIDGASASPSTTSTKFAKEIPPQL